MMESHRSGLQTAQDYTHSDPALRHQANKQAMLRFYQELQQDLVKEQKLQKLQDSTFINWYTQFKYWDAVKYSSNQQNQLNEVIAKLKVSNRCFRQITADRKEIQFDLASSFATYIQLKGHYDYIQETYGLAQQIQIEHENQNNMAYKSQIMNLRTSHKQLFGLECQWHYPKAEFRIVVLVRDELDKDKMLLIYNKQSQNYKAITRGSAMEASVFKQNDFDMAQNMQELIKCHIVKQSNQRQLQDFKNRFLYSLKNDFFDKVSYFVENQKKSQKRLTGNLALVESFRYYDRLQSEEMLRRWQNKASQHGKSKHLMIELPQIYIKTSLNPKSVALVLQNRKDQSTQNYKKKYQFKQTYGQYAVYQISKSQQKKCSPFKMPKGTLSKQINIRVEIARDRNSRTIYEHQYVYFKFGGEDSFPHHITLHDTEGNAQNDDQQVFVVLLNLLTHSPDHPSLEQNQHRALFNKVGSIPTKYRSLLNILYNPNTYQTVRSLLAPTLPTKVSKQSYQQCYFALVSFIQSEQNKSQMSVAHLHLDKITHKAPMRERLAYYERQFLLNISNVSSNIKGMALYTDDQTRLSSDQSKLISFLNSLDDKMFGQLCGRQFVVDQLHYKNVKTDLAFYQPMNQNLIEQLLVKFLHFTKTLPLINKFNYPLRYSPHLIPILQKYILLFFNSKGSSQDGMADRTKHAVHFFSFVLFLAKLYPYSQPTQLKNDLMTLRWMVQDKLSHYNDYLNRNHIGLENIIAPHLLNFFSQLSEELTFRIWDFIVSSSMTQKARISVAFTLLTYFQTTRNLPIIPINQFMDDVAKNFRDLPNNISHPTHITKSVDAYFSSENAKTKRLLKLIENKEKTVIDDRQLQKIIMGDALVNNQKQKRVEAHYKANKMVQPLKDLSYPLPKPAHFGHSIHELILFVHNLNILENISLMAQKYVLRFEVTEAKGQSTFDIPIVSKNHFYNESFKIPLMPYVQNINDREERRNIVVLVVKKSGDKKEVIELAGSFNYSQYHKDKAYKIILNLQSNNKHNKGETILHLSFCLKSALYNSKVEEIDFSATEKLSEQYLDYDMGDSNQIMYSLRQLFDTFEQMKSPLDEFSTEQNKRLKNSTLNFHASPWLQHSKVTVEELKTIFYHIFPQEKQHDLKLQFSKIYEIFAEEHQMQFVYLTQILTKIILSVNITRKKKLTYLYCLGVHYQNVYSKKITSETINSIIRMILKQQGFISPCPYDFDTCGKIVEAYFFCSSFKMNEEKNDFTEILQDLAYICNYKYEFNAIILGSGNNLSLLRNLFDQATLRKIQQQPECRFQILYEIQGKKHIWSAVVETKNFQILKRGTKFLNNFDGYNEIKYLDSTQEYLYHCENIIPLHTHRSYNYSEFSQVMLQNNLVRYALDMPSQLVNDEPKFEIVRTKDFDEFSRSSSSSQFYSKSAGDGKNQRVLDLEEQENYDSWAIHRSQNCLQSWRKCHIVNPGPILTEVKFQNDQDIYTISTLDLISMDEIELEHEIKKQMVRIITG